MAYNPQMYFPQSYQPMQYPMFQQMPPVQGTQMAPANQPQTTPQMMTPPTIHAEIVQVDNEEAAANYPVGAGASQMMIARDDSAIFVKTAGANGSTLDVFEKRPPAPPAPAFDPSAYVTRDEIEALVAAAMASQGKKKKEAAQNESV